MAVAKKKPTIQAREVAVGNRTLESVLIDLAEQIKANDARYAERAAQHEARAAQYEERAAQYEERAAQHEERSARAEEIQMLAIQTIAAVSRDLQALALRTDQRLTVLEKAIAAE